MVVYSKFYSVPSSSFTQSYVSATQRHLISAHDIPVYPEICVKPFGNDLFVNVLYVCFGY